MAKFIVHAHQTVVEVIDLLIEADSAEAAQAVAQAKIDAGEVNWQFYESCGDEMIDDVEVLALWTRRRLGSPSFPSRQIERSGF